MSQPTDPFAAPGEPNGDQPAVPATPPVYGSQPPVYGSQPPVYGSQPPAYGTDPAAQPPAYGQQPPAYGQQPQYPGQVPAYGQPAYGQAAYGGGYPKNSLGVWALCLGIAGMLLCGFLSGIPGAIVGHKALKANEAGLANNRGLALAGTIVSYVAIALSILGIIVFFAGGGFEAFQDAMREAGNTR